MSRVLVVEDEANIRKFLSINLTARGYEVIEAQSAQEGLEKLRSTLPAVLLLDIRLPDMSGWDLLRIIASDEVLSKIPAVVITASMGPGAPPPQQYDNLRKILIKPVSAQEVTRVVKEVLE